MMFGKLSLSAIPFHEPIIMITLSCVALGGLALLGAITYFKKWDYCGPSGLPRSTTRRSA
jgi:cytochrome o ubiquinol oxidase subunit 1